MAKQTLTAPFLSIDAVDLSDHVESVTLDHGAETNDASAGGDATRNMLPGLKTWSLQVNFRQDYAAGEIDATLFAKVGTACALVLRPNTGVVAPTNPEYTMSGILDSYQPLVGSIGNVIDAQANFVAAGDLARATA